MKKKTLLLNTLLLTGLMLTACPKVDPGYEVLDNWITEYTLNSTKLKSTTYEDILVIPVQFDGASRTNAIYSDSSYFKDFDEDELAYLENYYFGEGDSLVKYFENASLNKKTFKGEIAPVYHEEVTTIREMENDTTYTKLFKFLNKVVETTQSKMGENFVKKYDKNNDGFVDCVNFITNYRPGYNSLFWPHNYWTKGEKNEDTLSVFNYLIASTVKLQNPNKLIIHELSHMFGVLDYYSYSNDSADYVGCFDLQDASYGDWNAFSKFSVGWGKPYVVNGKNSKFSLRIGSNQTTGEYVIVPANYDKYNGTPFDEYFIIELINNAKNNARDIIYFKEDYGSNWTKDYGVRISHVNAEKSLINENEYYNGGYIQKLACKTKDDFESALEIIKRDGFEDNRIMFNNNNSSQTTSHEYVYGYDKNPLLSVIQKGGINTFGKGSNAYRHELNTSDLFYTGNSFTFEAYSTFITKDGKIQIKTNLGEDFPYTINFDEVTGKYAVMTFIKN